MIPTAIIHFLTTPIFFLTPYIFLWSILNGLITAGLLNLLKFEVSQKTLIVVAFTTAISSIVWNWSIEFNRSTIYLNVDHPLLRVSWADTLNSVCVFALVSFTLSMLTCRNKSAFVVTKVAGIAALVTLITDTFCF